MILQRFLQTILSALDWLIDLFFPHVVLLTVLLCLGLGAFFLAVVWRSRTRVVRRAVPSPVARAVRSSPKPPPP